MDTPLSVLIAEDSASDAGLMLRQLEKGGFEVIHQRVDTAEQMRKALGARAWDVVLSDFMVPGFGAASALALLHQSGLDLPFILVSGTIGEEAAVELMKAGAHDYVMKDHLGRLAPAVKREVGEARERLARRAAEQALRNSEASYRAVTQTATDAIVIANADGNITGWNLAAEKTFGYSEAEVLGRPLDLLMPQRYQSGHLCGMRRVQAGGERHMLGRTIELHGVTKAGTEFPLELSLSQWQTSAGMFFSGIIRDITERKRTESTLRVAATAFQTRDAMVIADAGNVILQINPSFTESTGYTAEEAVGKSMRLLKSGRHDAAFYAAMWECINRSGTWKGEIWNRRKSGEVYAAWLTITAVKGASGEVTHYVGTIADITETKRAERSLEESEKRFRGLIEQSLTGIYITRDGVFLYANPRLEQLLGYGLGELVGIGTEDLVIAEDLPVLRAEREKLRAGAVSSSYEVHLRRRDGSVIELGVQGRVFKFDGELATIGMAQDVTEKKRAQDQIKRYVAQLETAFMSTVEVAMTLSEMSDPYTAGHERRVAEIAVAIGAELGFEGGRLRGLRVAGFLHDIGKITIPAEILSKPGKLSPIEFMLIQGHAQASHDVLKKVQFPWPVAEVALQHHERMDGSGYPQGLKGEAILLEARIMAVADVVEAMSSHRPYRAGLGIEKALAEIERGRGTGYDAMVADACLKLFREKGYALPA